MKIILYSSPLRSSRMLMEEYDGDKVQGGTSKDMNVNFLQVAEGKDTSDDGVLRSKEANSGRTESPLSNPQCNSDNCKIKASQSNKSGDLAERMANFRVGPWPAGAEEDKNTPQHTAHVHEGREENGHGRVPNSSLGQHSLADLVSWENQSSFCLVKKITPSRENLVVHRSVLVTVCAAILGLCAVLVTLPPPASGFVPDFIEWGYCSDVHLQHDFDPVKYQGWWWDIYRVPNSYEGVDKCIYQNISLKDGVLVVDMEGLSAAGQLSNKTALVAPDTSGPAHDPARRTVDANGVPSAPYLVVATDYLQYACVYSCLQFPGVFAEFFWVFGRHPVLDEKYSRECVRHFRLAGVQPEKLVKVEQGETCHYSSRLEAMQGTNEEILKDVKRDETAEELLSYASVSTADSALLREGRSTASPPLSPSGGWGASVAAAVVLSWTQGRGLPLGS